MYNINIYGDSEDRESSFQQSSGNDAKNKYNLNNINANFGDFFKSDLKSFENEEKKKEEKEDKIFEKGNNKFMDDIIDEIGDSGLNNNSSKLSQKESKIKNKSTNKSNKIDKKNSIDNNEIEELSINRDENDNEEIESIRNENENKEKEKNEKNEAEKRINMENYLKEHQKINMIINNNKKEQNISVQSNEIEENINTYDNMQKNNSKIKEEEDDYGGFDNINSETMNNQNIQTSSVAQSKKNIKSKNNNNSNINKQILSSDSYNKYMGEFDQSKINEINKLEENNNKNEAESLINAVNNEHQTNTKNLMNKNENIYSNNNININSVGSGDSVNIKNMIKNEINKYDDNNKPGYKKEEYNNNEYNNKYNYNKNLESQLYTFKNEKFTNLKKINTNYFSIYKPMRKQTDLLKLKNDEVLKQERNKRQKVESELNAMRKENEKLLEELNRINNQKNENIKELKNDYEMSLKNMENNVLKREKQKFENLMRDLENKYQTDIIKKANEIDRLKNECEYLESRYNNLDNEYKRLKESKENEEQLNNLKSENYQLQAKINQIKNKKDPKEKNNNINNENNNNKSDTMKIYEQLLNEREINAQEKLLNNYLKEIKKLNEEIIFLKSMNYPKKQQNNSSNEEIIINNQNNQKINNYIINPSLQESAEKQIKKLQNFLLPSSNDPINDKLIIMEKEFSRLQNKESPNEITFTNYLNVMKQLKVPLTSNELVEIFNNFPRIKGDRIRMNDFINAINSKSPSSFFLQSDPSYLNDLESRLIKAQNRIKELSKHIIINNNENEEFKSQLKKTMEENQLLKNKINELNSKILQYFLFREEKNISNPDVIQMKEKMRVMEIKSKTMDNELSEKFGKYEKRIEELQKTYEDERNNLLKEKDGFKDQINKLRNEKEKVKNEYDKKEIKLKTEIEKLNEKLEKYKKNYIILNNRNEMNKREKEQILNSFKEKGLEPEHILTFVNNSSNIQEILEKINELERKNLNREEIYKRICLEVNQTQVNKELEKQRKKFEEEKKGLLKIIAQKNNELNSIKSEFFEIMNELEKLKINKFK